MTKFSPKNLKLVGEGYLSKVCYKKRLFYPLPPPGSLIIGGSRVEHEPPEMALSPLVGLLQNGQILTGVSLAHLLKDALKSFDEPLTVRRLQRQNKIAKVNAIIFYLQEEEAVKISF